MSTEQITNSKSIASVPPKSKSISQHPLSPLTGAEISQATKIIHAIYPAKTKLQFKAITLQEPPKAQLLPYLDTDHNGRALPSIERKVFVNYYIRNTVIEHIMESYCIL